MDKKYLINKFQKTPEKFWFLDFFKERGFSRKKCANCGKFFWTLRDDQKICNDSSCRPYEFIGNPLTKKNFDYFDLWKKVKKFFEKEGHKNVKRYPVICKWFPELYFTIAGVVDFYRKNGDKFVFELPENPVLILQPSLRFNDIPQVGVSGRHWTCHSHLEQASLYDGKTGYWKERCIELDYRMLTEVLGIKPELINFLEDAWLGPGAFGYSLEYHVGGIELGNAVFTEFRGTPNKFEPMKKKLIDMGAGFDRFVWISKGSPTNYDAVFGDIIKKIIKKVGLKYDKKIFEEYSKLSGVLNLEERDDVKEAKKEIADKIGVEERILNENIEPLQAIYAICDHIQTLLFAVSDGGIPSNTGGGYNLRVILRRVISFIEEYDFDIDVNWIASEIAIFWKPLYPELKENLNKFSEIFEIEKEKYRETMKNSKKTIEKMLNKRGRMSEEELIELYDSKGISPEYIKEMGEKINKKIEIPPKFYRKVTEKHEKTKKEKKRHSIEKKLLKNIEDTKILFYENIFSFKAKVLKIIDAFVILDKTTFYPRSGGQEPDLGEINGCKVKDVEKIDKIIIHKLEKINFKVGDEIECKVDKKRRKQLTQHHTATHIINASAREVLGDHVWQGGTKKDMEKAHLDITHYKQISDQELEKIEKKVNEIINKNYKVKKEILERPHAEKKYGFRIYQGAAVPSKRLRIVSIDDIEHEACAGTHVKSTGEIEKIIILKTEKPSDGTIRLFYVAGDAAKKLEKKFKSIIEESGKILETENNIISETKKLVEKSKENRKKIEELKEKIATQKAEKLDFEKIKGYKVLIKEMRVGKDELQKISLKMTEGNTLIFLFGVSGEKIELFASSGDKVKLNVGSIMKEVVKILDGKGGGSPKLAQGFGKNKGKIKEAKEKIREMIQNA